MTNSETESWKKEKQGNGWKISLPNSTIVFALVLPFFQRLVHLTCCLIVVQNDLVLPRNHKIWHRISLHHSADDTDPYSNQNHSEEEHWFAPMSRLQNDTIIKKICNCPCLKLSSFCEELNTFSVMYDELYIGIFGHPAWHRSVPFLDIISKIFWQGTR